MSSTRTNADVAQVFSRLADYLELSGENTFKIRAYRVAADTLRSLNEPIARVASEGRLDDLPGFGQAIRAKTLDILATGTTPAYEKARTLAPEGVLEFLRLPGIGVKTIRQLVGIGISNIDDLEQAVREGRVSSLWKVGEKTEANILDSIVRYRAFGGTLILNDAIDAGEVLRAELLAWPEVEQAAFTGDLERGVETVAAIELIVATTNPTATTDALAELDQVVEVTSTAARKRGRPRKGSLSESAVPVQPGSGPSTMVCAKLKSEALVEVTLASPAVYTAARLIRTGSSAHVAKLATIAREAGFNLTEYGLFQGDLRVENVREESDYYAALGLPPIPAQLREDRGEIEAALAGTLPKLIELSDIQGDMHTHTVASDGKAAIDDMVRTAKALGYEYLAITDHSQSLAVANGLSEERLRNHIRDIRDAEQRAGIRLFAGTEVDIKADGSLDYPDDVLAQLDVVVASVHTRFKQTRAEMTARVVRAIEHPAVDVIGHPTGRHLGTREPYELDVEAAIAAAARTDTALEINGHPERQDLRDIDARAAHDAGVMIMIDTDAHSTVDLKRMRYGINVARRAWLTARDVLNTSPLSQIEEWLQR